MGAVDSERSGKGMGSVVSVRVRVTVGWMGRMMSAVEVSEGVVGFYELIQVVGEDK